MYIQPVNQTNFNGLWKLGKVKQYYPFLDETKSQIDKAVSSSKESTKVMGKLPFTIEQFLQYTKNRLNITKERVIDKYFYLKGLSAVSK